MLVVGCTAEPADPREQVTSEQADELAAQVAVQEALVAAFAAAGSRRPGAGHRRGRAGGQAQEQLDAAEGRGARRVRLAVVDLGVPPRPARRPRPGCATQIADTATSHATACLDQSGARAALLGSIAAGLRGQDAVLA